MPYLSGGYAGLQEAAAGGLLQQVGDVVISGAAATSMVLTGLDIDTDVYYWLKWNVRNAIAGNNINLHLEYNGDNNINNYYIEYNAVQGAAHVFGNLNNSVIGGTGVGLAETTSGDTMIYRDATGLIRSWSASLSHLTNAMNNKTYMHYWITNANLTQLQLRASIANGININSRMTLFSITPE